MSAGAPGVSYAAGSASVFAASGSVLSDGTNHYVAQARVVLCDDGGNPLEETFTNESGDFSFQGLRTGHYLLRVQAHGYQHTETHVHLSLGSQRGLAITVRPVSPETAWTAGQQTFLYMN